jgi:carboxylesterase
MVVKAMEKVLDSSRIIPTAGPFFFPGGETGCLLVHGFPGSPREMRGLGAFLAEQGFAVLGIRLAGLATQPEDLWRIRWQDWLASLEDGWYLLNDICRRIFLVGLSAGGALALLFASHKPAAGVVAMSTPYALPDDPRLRFLPILRYLMPRVIQGPDEWRDPEAGKGHVVYPYFPTRMVAEVGGLLKAMRAALPLVTAPVLQMHSRQDNTAAPAGAEKIYQALGSADKQLLWLEDTSHNIVMDAQRQIVFRAAADFIHRVGAGE